MEHDENRPSPPVVGRPAAPTESPSPQDMPRSEFLRDVAARLPADHPGAGGLADAERLAELRRALKALRKSKGMLQAEIGGLLGMDQADISRLENGLTGRMELYRLRDFVRACGARIGFVIVDDSGNVFLNQAEALIGSGQPRIPPVEYAVEFMAAVAESDAAGIPQATAALPLPPKGWEELLSVRLDMLEGSIEELRRERPAKRIRAATKRKKPATRNRTA